MMCINLQILNAYSFFGFSQLIGNIIISGNCRVRIYKYYMPEHFCFGTMTKFCYKCCVPTYWSCIHKFVGTYSKIYNQKVKYLTDDCLHADKKKSSNLVLKFTVGRININVKLLFIVSFLSCTKAKKFVTVNSEKTTVFIVFWKLCTAAVHLDTVNNIHDFQLQLHIHVFFIRNTSLRNMRLKIPKS